MHNSLLTIHQFQFYQFVQTINNMTMKILISFLIILFTFNAYSQSSKNVFDNVGIKYSKIAKTNIYQSSQIKDIVNDITYHKSLGDGIVGYRIQIFSSSSKTARQRALGLESSFRASNQGIEPYLKYKSPNFKVCVGDFRTKSEALKTLKDIQSKYFNAFIIKDVISPKIDY